MMKNDKIEVSIQEDIFFRGHSLEFIGLYSYIKYLEHCGVNKHEIYRLATLQHEEADRWVETMDKIGLLASIKPFGI